MRGMEVTGDLGTGDKSHPGRRKPKPGAWRPHEGRWRMEKKTFRLRLGNWGYERTHSRRQGEAAVAGTVSDSVTEARMKGKVSEVLTHK